MTKDKNDIAEQNGIPIDEFLKMHGVISGSKPDIYNLRKEGKLIEAYNHGKAFIEKEIKISTIKSQPFEKIGEKDLGRNKAIVFQMSDGVKFGVMENRLNAFGDACAKNEEGHLLFPKDWGRSDKGFAYPIVLKNLTFRAHFSWVLYDYLKQNASIEKYNHFIKYLKELSELKLPETEKMLFDNAAWQIGKLLFQISKTENIDYQKVNSIFDLIKEFHFTKPSDSYSFLFKAFHKCYKGQPKYFELAEWWGLENFQDQDYQKFELDNGKKIMSMAEQTYIAYSKNLLEGEIMNPNILEKEINKEKIEGFLPRLDNIIQVHPEYQYPPYFKAKLLLASGDKENVLSAFLPFAKKKSNDFWVWDVLSDIFENEPEKKTACLCRALICKSPEDFLVNTRLKLAEILIGENLFSEAKTEIEKLIATRESKKWKVSQKIKNWQSSDWYKSAKENKNNYSFYKKNAPIADEILFYNIPEEDIIVEFVNKDKKVLNFIVNKEKHGFFKYDRFINKVEVGDVLSVRFGKSEESGFYKIHTLKLSNNEPGELIVKEFRNRIRINEKQSFGFVEDFFISPDLIKKYSLENGNLVSGKALISYNKKKKSWGWKAFNIQKVNNLSKVNK